MSLESTPGTQPCCMDPNHLLHRAVRGRREEGGGGRGEGGNGERESRKREDSVCYPSCHSKYELASPPSLLVDATQWEPQHVVLLLAHPQLVAKLPNRHSIADRTVSLFIASWTHMVMIDCQTRWLHRLDRCNRYSTPNGCTFKSWNRGARPMGEIIATISNRMVFKITLLKYSAMFVVVSLCMTVACVFGVT